MSIHGFIKKIIPSGIKSKVASLFSDPPINHRKNDLARMTAIDVSPTQKILVGTHHKTGTAWMMKVFRDISRFHSLKYFQGKQDDLPEDYDVFLQDHSYFDFDGLERPYRGVHLIRDPRDVIISGCFYHQTADEDWLHYSRADLDGATYQERLNQLPTLEEKLIFEMEHVGKWTIEEMEAWDYQNPRFMEIKYEDLISDYDLQLFHELFTFLGFPGAAIPGLLAVAYHHSLFSGNFEYSTHIRSGKKEQWRNYFNDNLKNRFIELFDDVLVKLGYESSQDW